MLYIYLSALDTDEEKDYFEELYLKYRQKMYGIAYSILHNEQDSEDAVHQAFLKMADNFSKILKIPRQELPAYIVIIIRNTSINIYNKNKKRSEHIVELRDDQPALDIDFFENIDYEQLTKVISQLPDNYKDVLYLRYVNDLSCKEIAKMLDISVDSVYKRIERAKRSLKEALEEGGNNG